MTSIRPPIPVIVCIILVLCSSISPCAASSSSLSAVCPIVLLIHSGEIRNGEDVDTFSTITNADTDSHDYEMVPTTDNGHPATVITALDNPSSESNIVEKGESFDIDLTIPKGIYFYLVVEISSLFAQNRINITCSSPSCSISWNNANGGTHYIGMVGDTLSDVPSGEDNWIYSESDSITITLDGRRGTAWGQNWGGLKVTLVMKETV